MGGSPLWMPSALLPLCAYVRSCFGACSGISFMDSTSLNMSQPSHQATQGVRELGSARQDLGGLVLWLQIAFSRQRQGRVARALS
jgi:hypothetical protein